MAMKRGNEIATIDVALVTLQVEGETDELVLNTSSKIQVNPQIETQDAVKLIIKGILKAQKPQVNTVTGNTIVVTDNVFNPHLLLILQGGTVTFDPVDTTKVIKYEPPVAGSGEKGKVATLRAYSAIYDEAALIVGYEKITYPSCQGVPISLSSEDNVFRVSEYTINSAPKQGEAPYTIEFIKPEELPVLPVM